MTTLEDLLIEQVRDLYDAEKQLVRALPKMAEAAHSDDLQRAIQNHLEETKNQVSRLEQVFKELDEPAKPKACKGMRGLVEEGDEALNEDSEEQLTDLAIIAAAQKVEHYEISAYGTARAIAQQLGQETIASLLEETEEEEKAADSTLTEIATSLLGETRSAEEMDEEETESEDIGQEDTELEEIDQEETKPGRKTTQPGKSPRHVAR